MPCYALPSIPHRLRSLAAQPHFSLSLSLSLFSHARPMRSRVDTAGDEQPPPFKRLYAPSFVSPSPSPPPSFTTPTCSPPSPLPSLVPVQALSPLLRVLTPVRLLLHPLFADEDVARLCRVSRSFSRALLSGYSFTQRVFLLSDPPTALRRTSALYERYGLHITRVRVVWPMAVNESTVGCPVPSSVKTMAITSHGWVVTEPMLFSPTSIFSPLGNALLRVDCRLPWGSSASCAPELKEESDERRCCRLFTRDRLFPFYWDHTWPELRGFGEMMSAHVPIHLFPQGLRALHLTCHLPSPLQPGSIPATVHFLQLDYYTCPLLPHVLPASLLHFVWNSLTHPLPQDVLPPGLETMQCGQLFHMIHPLVEHSLPPSLRSFQANSSYHQSLFSGLFPSGLLHLGMWLDYDLVPAVQVLPQCLVTLQLEWRMSRNEGKQEMEAFEVGFLPPSIRDLHLGFFTRRLLPGCLHEGLHFLRLQDTRPAVHVHSLGAGILPSTLIALDLSGMSHPSIDTLSSPSGLRHLKLPWGSDITELHLPSTVLVTRQGDE